MYRENIPQNPKAPTDPSGRMTADNGEKNTSNSSFINNT